MAKYYPVLHKVIILRAYTIEDRNTFCSVQINQHMKENQFYNNIPKFLEWCMQDKVLFLSAVMYARQWIIPVHFLLSLKTHCSNTVSLLERLN